MSYDRMPGGVDRHGNVPDEGEIVSERKGWKKAEREARERMGAKSTGKEVAGSSPMPEGAYKPKGSYGFDR